MGKTALNSSNSSAKKVQNLTDKSNCRETDEVGNW